MPKPAQDDADAPRRVTKILASESYVEAEDDVDFLKGDTARGVRLLIEYLKVESILERERISHTILVLGGTRIAEPKAAQREVARARRKRDLIVAQHRLANSRYYEVARQFGRLVGRMGKRLHNGRAAIMTGGGPGIMEAANRGAHDVGAPSLGLNISLPHAQYPNPYVTPSLCFQFRYFALRKLHFLLRARALVAFPGGFGTFDELFETLTLVQTRKIKPLPVVLVGEAYWRRAFDVDFLLNEGTIDPEDRELFWFAETAPEIWNGIVRWYRLAGEPIFGSH